MASHTVISLDSDDDEPVPSAPRSTASGKGTSRDAPVELLDSDDDVPPAAACSSSGSGSGSTVGASDGFGGGSGARPAKTGRQRGGSGTAASSSAAAAAVDLTDDSNDPVGCGLCGRWPSERELYALDECGHVFCESCVRLDVTKKVAEMMAHEVGCPTCGKQLSIRNVNDLAKSAEPAGKRARPDGAWGGGGGGGGGGGFGMSWMGGGGGSHAAMLAQMTGVPMPSMSRPRVQGNPAATKRLMKELRAIQKADSESQGFDVSIPDESDVYTWQAEFFNFDKGSALDKDLKKVPGKRIVLSVAFSSSYPATPPYVRVIRPRFAFRTGHVTIGGSICTEMLTSQGWLPSMTMESVLLGIRTNMLVGGARLDPHNKHDYSEMEAKVAFDRMVREHGWY